MKIFIGTREVPGSETEKHIKELSRRISELGIREGDPVICKADSQYGIIIEWLSCQETGAVPLFIAPDFPEDTCRFTELSDVRLCVYIKNNMEISISEVNGKGPHLALTKGSVIHMTSATSGKPKFILRTREMLDLELERYIRRLQLTKQDVIMSIAPFFHAYAFLCPMLCSIYTGATLVQPALMLPRNIVQLAEEMKVTCMYGVPYFLDRMADIDEQFGFSDKIRYIVSSGEKLTKETADKFAARFGIPLRQQFGCTEIGTVTFSEADEPYESQGAPIDGVEIVIDDDGRLNINTHGTMGFYINENVAPIAGNDGFFYSNDMGHFDEKGRLFIDGRADDVIIRAGEKINLREIGAIIERMPDVRGASLKVGNDVLKEIICYYKADKDIPADEFKRYCRSYLSDYQIPNYSIRTEEEVGQKENWKHSKK